MLLLNTRLFFSDLKTKAAATSEAVPVLFGLYKTHTCTHIHIHTYMHTSAIQSSPPPTSISLSGNETPQLSSITRKVSLWLHLLASQFI